MLKLIVSPVRGQLFEARLNGRLLCEAKEPLFSACRVLQAEGVPGDTVVRMYHKGSEAWSLSCTVAKGASLSIVDSDKQNPTIVKYRPFGDTKSLLAA